MRKNFVARLGAAMLVLALLVACGVGISTALPTDVGMASTAVSATTLTTTLTTVNNPAATAVAIPLATVTGAELLTENATTHANAADYAWDAATVVPIKLAGDVITVAGEGATVAGSTITTLGNSGMRRRYYRDRIDQIKVMQS